MTCSTCRSAGGAGARAEAGTRGAARRPRCGSSGAEEGPLPLGTQPPLHAALLTPPATLLTILMQATTNALLSHFFSLVCSLWLLRIIANRPSAAHMMATAGAPGASSSGARPAAA